MGERATTLSIREYLSANSDLQGISSVEFLAAGEYNENYRVTTSGQTVVFRINHGTQLGLADQIAYEFAALAAVAPSGVTPKPLELFPPSESFPRGAITMEFLPGEPFDYSSDSDAAASTFAKIHRLPIDESLIRQIQPVLDIVAECRELLSRHNDHPRSDLAPILWEYLEEVAEIGRSPDADFSSDDFCIVNTEVNSGNFLVNNGVAFLVDWEKAVVSYRYQDLAHYLAPTTTHWKSDHQFGSPDRERFLCLYHHQASPPVSFEQLDDWTAIMERVIVLRGLSWCYMAYAEYEAGSRFLSDPSTFRTITHYLDHLREFIDAARS